MTYYFYLNLSTRKYHKKLNLLLTEMCYREPILNGWINYIGTERTGRKYHVQAHPIKVLCRLYVMIRPQKMATNL